MKYGNIKPKEAQCLWCLEVRDKCKCPKPKQKIATIENVEV